MSVMKDGLSTFMDWFAWTISLGASVLFMIHVCGGDMPELAGKNMLLLFLPWLFIAVVGCLLSLFKQTIGASMMLLGGLGMGVTLYLHGGSSQARMMIIYSGPYILAAFLMLIMRKR
jgi:hypothetical protein